MEGFSVYTLTDVSNQEKWSYAHWSKGLTMFIKKGDISITLSSEEIIELVKSLPRTIGGKY